MLKSFESGAARLASMTSLVALTTALGGCAAGQISSEDQEKIDQAAGEESNLGTVSSKIIGGSTTTAFSAVGALIFDPQTSPQGFSFALCTGTVIAPRVVLTAAHCVAEATASKTYFTLQPTVGKDPVALNATLAKSIRAVRTTAHPNYDATRTINDIGIVILESDAPVTPLAINTTALDSLVPINKTASTTRAAFTFVGYGVSNGFSKTGDGIKRQTSIPILQVAATQFAQGSPSTSICFGDSGGPAIAKNAQGTPVVVGVSSYVGNGTCTSYSVDTRVDAFTDFIRQASTL